MTWALFDSFAGYGFLLLRIGRHHHSEPKTEPKRREPDVNEGENASDSCEKKKKKMELTVLFSPRNFW